MPIAPNPFVIQAQMRYTQDAQEVENILYFNVGSAASGANCAALADELAVWWDTSIQPLQPTSVTLREVYCKVMLNGTAPEGTSTFGLPADGTGIGSALPNNVTCSVSFRTGFSGRSFRGRNFIIGLQEAQVTQNEVSNVTIAAWEAAYEQLLPGAGVITEGEWCVYSQWSNNVLRATGLPTAVLDVLFKDDTVDSQRRRLPGRGR